MKLNSKLFISALLFLITHFTFAQNVKSVRGNVTDADGIALPGVSVIIKGTGTGAVTDFDGNYQINAEETSILLFDYLGYVSQEVPAAGKQNINVSLAEDTESLNEVIVTALGLEKKKDEDLSSSTSIDTDAVSRSAESGVLQGMAGKTSNVKITRNSGDPGAGAFILIRGQNSISGNIEPLTIIDGVPMSNSNINITDDDTNTGGVAEQSRLNDINPDDIETITILKGAQATAVWGTQAANGAIVITTKRGKIGGESKFKVNVKASVIFDKINVEFDKQDTFGQGDTTGAGLLENGEWAPFTGNSWGDLISSRSGGADDVIIGNERFVADNGSVVYPITQKNSTDTFNGSNADLVFGTGITTDKSVSLTYSGPESSTYVSYSDWDQQGIIRGNSDYRRQTLKFNQTTKMNEKLTMKLNTNYSKVKSNRVQQGSNIAGLYLGYLRSSPDYDISGYKGTYFDENNVPTPNSQSSYRNYLGSSAPVYNNPLWTINEQDNPNEVERFIINPELVYQLLPSTTITARYGLDFYTDDRENFFPTFSSVQNPTGFFRQEELKEKNENFNVFAQTNHSISDNFSLNAIAGFTFDRNQFSRLSASSVDFTNPFVDELRVFGNADAGNETPTKFISETRKSAVYGVVSSEIFNQVLLEATGRYERSSTLESNVFYPSAAIGWQFSEAIPANDILSFGKLRLAYGEVGIEPQAYLSNNTFEAGGVLASFGEELLASQYENPFAENNVIGNPDLTVERVKEYEVGTDLRFLNNRVTFGFTYYDRVTEDAILQLDAAPSSGQNSIFANGAEISNKGVELDLGLKIVSTKDFKFSLNANFAQNENVIESLSGVESVFLSGFAGTSSRAVEGESVGSLWGGKFARDEDDNLVLDANGFPTVAEEEGLIGDPNPDWTGGLGAQFAYKGVTLSVQFETSQGNDVWAGSQGVLNTFGISQETANISTSPSALVNYAGETIAANSQFRGNITDFGGGAVALDHEWYRTLGGGFGAVGEQFVQDGSWTRLRELSLGYTFPNEITKQIGLDNLSFTVTGRNLVLWTDVEGFDPDLNLTGATRGRGLEYFTNPATQSYAFTVKFGF